MDFVYTPGSKKPGRARAQIPFQTSREDFGLFNHLAFLRFCVFPGSLPHP
jgi:hypothetical protein